ncbi:MAG: PIN domain-containing protein [Candidatus Dormibacteria bacterium]
MMPTLQPSGDEVALADTSVFVAAEQGRRLSTKAPKRLAVSVITVAELWLGVLAAPDARIRAQRMKTLSAAESLAPLPVDENVARAWAALRLSLHDLGKRMPINDSWIAATALAHTLAVASQDADYDEVPGLHVIRV